MVEQIITAERFRALVSYSPETGVFQWRVSRHGGIMAGAVCGSVDVSSGYERLTVCRRTILAHRAAFLYMEGTFPTGDVDHVNGDRADNRWLNLRSVSRALNIQNQRRTLRPENESGLLGVYAAPSGRWRTRIKTHGISTCIGTFDTPEEAHEAYLAAKRALHAGCTI
jgi:hypothetical protein